MRSTRFLVVGAGLAGASAAWRLAQRGEQVTLVERTRPAAADGSSHGSARIFRYAYPERTYVDLVARSAPGWDELAELHGSPLVRRCGALDFGARRDPHGLARVLAEVGVEHELLTRAEARERWPQIAFDTDVLHHAAGGVLDAEGTVATMVAAAQALGAQVLTGWPLARLERTASGYTATSADGRTVRAEQVVVAAGGWLPDLLADLALPSGFVAALPDLRVTVENAFHFPYREDVAPAADWPTLIHKRDDICTYALPGGRDAQFRGQKVAEYDAGARVPSAATPHDAVDPANRARVVDYVRRFLPGLVPEPYAGTTCLFSTTPGEDFVVDTADGVTVLSPCSGHGAKFAPLLGELAADVALGTGEVPAQFRPGLSRV